LDTLYNICKGGIILNVSILVTADAGPFREGSPWVKVDPGPDDNGPLGGLMCPYKKKNNPL